MTKSDEFGRVGRKEPKLRFYSVDGHKFSSSGLCTVQQETQVLWSQLDMIGNTRATSALYLAVAG